MRTRWPPGRGAPAAPCRLSLAGAPAAAWLPGGDLRVVYEFTTSGDRITEINLIADPERLGELDLVVVEETAGY